MNIETKLRLSFYEELCDVDALHGVKLVRHVESRQFFVLKSLKIYDLRVFEYLFEHPTEGIPRIEEFIEDDQILYLIEEFVPGASLRYQLGKEGPFSEDQACDLIRQLCNILRPLHKLTPPIVHRDIKPENLIVTAGNRLVLVDFNSAKTSKPSQRKDTVLIGTVGYAAPEQYGFNSSQPTADIYAIGVLLNELLTGRMPQEKLYEGSLTYVIKKCLQMDPSNRYQSVDELLQSLFFHHISAARILESIHAWLPPGLRGSKRAVIIFSALGYILLFSATTSIHFEGNSSMIRLYLGRLCFFLLFLLEIFWFGNYRSIWKKFQLTRSRNPFFRTLGLAIGFFLIFFAVMVLLSIFV